MSGICIELLAEAIKAIFDELDPFDNIDLPSYFMSYNYVTSIIYGAVGTFGAYSIRKYFEYVKDYNGRFTYNSTYIW